MRCKWPVMNVTLIGTGYVGLVTGTCLAEVGNQVVCVDSDVVRVRALQAGECPFFEPELNERVLRNLEAGRLSFTDNLAGALLGAPLVMVAVGTHSQGPEATDLTAVRQVVAEVARLAPSGCRLVLKSTMPVGSSRALRGWLDEQGRSDIVLLGNPEFLKQGDAVRDFLHPDRVIVGADRAEDAEPLRELYAPFLLERADKLLVMDLTSAELTKYAANAFLATKISFINEVSALCEAVGGDVRSVRGGLGSDPRIGELWLSPGLGFGGSCIPKDLQALIRSGQEAGQELPLLRGVERVNREQRRRFCRRIVDHFGGRLAGRRLALWGAAFKANTDDVRDAPAFALIDCLLEHGARMCLYDPRASERVRAAYGNRLDYAATAYGALAEADALVIATEWDEFRRPDFERMRASLRAPVIFDGRNLYAPATLRELGFHYVSVGCADPDRAAHPKSSSIGQDLCRLD